VFDNDEPDLETDEVEEALEEARGLDCVCAGPSVKVADVQYDGYAFGDFLGMPEIVIFETRYRWLPM